MPLLSPKAHLARDLAAPMKRAVTSLARCVRLRLPAPPTTHDVTAVYID